MDETDHEAELTSGAPQAWAGCFAKGFTFISHPTPIRPWELENQGSLTPGDSAARSGAGGLTQASGAEVEKPRRDFSDFGWPVHARLAPHASVSDTQTWPSSGLRP